MKTAAPIPFAGSQLSNTRHICAFFNSDEEEYRVLLPFIKDGFHCGDKAVHVVNPEQRKDHLRRLAEAGIDTSAAEQMGQLELRTNTEVYLRDGHFDQDRMLAVFEQAASGDVKATRSEDVPVGGVVGTQDGDLHQVSNLQGGGKDLVTLHVYAPPLLRMGTYSILDSTRSVDVWTEWIEGGGI